ncbi:unnamed protein product [Durusdinium trenchii]|uniref:Uncharacterized protein n=1 Tax=Durusdinium trenchii TaxID=1381693 RepID=A0ABP0KV02_9DINO
MVFRGCNVLFLKQVETRLSSLVWDAYQFLANTKSVVVNAQASKPEVRVKVPIPDELCLPLVGGKFSPFKTPGSMFLCHFFGVEWYMDKPIGNTADFCIPATAAKTVTRSDLAFFKSIQKELTVVAKHSIYGGDNDLDLVLLERQWITSATKAKKATAKKASKKKAQAASEQDDRTTPNQEREGNREMFAQLSVDMPVSAEEQVKLLKELLETDTKLDECIRNAKNSVKKPETVAINKLATDDEKHSRSHRAKLMAEAIEAAKKYENAKAAALINEEKKGVRVAVPKKKAAKSDEAKLVLALGKHLLK